MPVTVSLTAAERRAVEQCEGGVWLACDEQAGVTIWPRAVYPALDDALIELHDMGTTGDPDLEAYPFRARLVWAYDAAWTHDDEPSWVWSGRPPLGALTLGMGIHVECWEITWL